VREGAQGRYFQPAFPRNIGTAGLKPL
jgi:hypothetical protein